MRKSSIVIPLKEFSHQYEDAAFIRGEGAYLYDENGTKYIDCISGLWNTPLGYGNERIVKAVSEQAAKLSYVNIYSSMTPVIMNYADKLISKLSPDFSRFIYTCSGSESIECAIKMARKYQRLKGYNNRHKIAVFDVSYHGTTYAAMSASGIDQVESKMYGPMVNGFVMLKTPLHITEEEAAADINEKLGDGSEIAAILIEPVIGSGGIIEVPDWYIEKLRDFAEKNNVLVIFDEVATGFGRTGTLFAYNQMNIKPDILTLSKAIDNGVIPMGSVLLSPKVADFFLEKDQYLEHFSTQNGNPIACAAASETLDIISDDGLISHVKELGEYMLTELREKLTDFPIVREVRGRGLMIGIDLAKENGQMYDMEFLYEIEGRMKKKGLLIYPFIAGDITSGFSLFPTFITDKKLADKIINTVCKVLSSF